MIETKWELKMLQKITIFSFFILGGFGTMGEAADRQIRTYMSYTLPHDPARVQTMEDMDMSYALASTLLDLTPEKQIQGSLSNNWKDVDDRTIRFIIREDAKWADGTPITAAQVKRSLERGKEAQGGSLRDLYDSIESIKTSQSNAVDFRLKPGRAKSDLLLKLTEPMFGVIMINGKSPDPTLSRSSGPYMLRKNGPNEVRLDRNKHWFGAESNMAESVIIRQRPEGVDPRELLKDKWVNLITLSSVIPPAALKKLEKEGYSIWERNLDRIFSFHIGPRLNNENGLQLMRYLHQKIDHKLIGKGLAGYDKAAQLYPSGYTLHDEKFICSAKLVQIPEEYKKRPLVVLYSPDRVYKELLENLKSALHAATGIRPKFVSKAIRGLSQALATNKYDFYAGSFAVTDPNPEGSLSYLLEMDIPVILSGSGKKDFASRYREIKREQNQLKRYLEYKKILTDAVCYGYVTPLFYYSKIAIARPGINLDKIPTTDESVAFSKVRFVQ